MLVSMLILLKCQGVNIRNGKDIYKELMARLLSRLRRCAGLKEFAVLFLIGCLLVNLWGGLTDFVELKALPPCQAAVLLVFSFIMPAIPEEIVFRGFLVRPAAVVDGDMYWEIGTEVSKRPPVKEQIANIAIFVLYHLGIGHEQPVFSDPKFLVIVAIGGCAFQEALIRTESLWPSVFLHFLSVWVWITFEGGADKLADGGIASATNTRNTICGL